MSRQIEVVFEIDEETGDFSADVLGHEGPGCLDQILAELEGLIGPATVTKKKPEYNRRVRRTVQAGRKWL